MSQVKDKWIQKSDIKKGALHRSLGIPQGKNIPPSKLEKATHSSNPLIKKRAVWAENVKKK